MADNAVRHQLIREEGVVWLAGVGSAQADLFEFLAVWAGDTELKNRVGYCLSGEFVSGSWAVFLFGKVSSVSPY